MKKAPKWCFCAEERNANMSFLYFLEGLRNPVLDFLFSLITRCGEETVFMAVGMIVFWCFNKYKGYYLLCVGFIGTVINQFLKILCRVPRPWVKDPSFLPVEGTMEAATGYSFPSGHTQTSVGLFGGIARATRIRALRIGMIVLAALVAFSRMYLGVHTPADVLVSLGIATLLVFVAYPLFKKAEESPRVMYGILGSFTAIMVAYILFVMLYQFPEEVYHVDAIENLISARKNGFTLLGCAVGLLVTYTVDLKWTHFDTKAVWWAQILKVVGGLALVVAVKALLKAPLNALLVNEYVARSVRYFLMVVVGGVLWPMTFKSFARLGRKQKEGK